MISGLFERRMAVFVLCFALTMPSILNARQDLPESGLQSEAASIDGSASISFAKPGETDELELDIESARQKVAEQKTVFDETKRLSAVGSASQAELRRANFDYKMAMLDLIVLENPAAQNEVAVARAKLEFDVTSLELTVIESLFRKGSASELEFQRARSAMEIAELGLKAVNDGRGEKYYRVKIAQNNLDLALEIELKAVRLYNASSISGTVFERVKANLQAAEDELELAKRELGVQVRQVPVSDGSENGAEN